MIVERAAQLAAAADPGSALPRLVLRSFHVSGMLARGGAGAAEHQTVGRREFSVSYGNRIQGLFHVTPPVPPESVGATSASLHGWRISPNGQILYLPSDADEPDALGALEHACEVLRQASYSVNGDGQWQGEDGVTGSVVVAAGIVRHSESE